ncbi:hypothetical protein G3I60_19415 [Streptomyces sp. SID13666]|uniref:hypothetical protein n=1 Tax=unclassified Streptomyces TaxID=2593676 RepID=UPI0013C236B9|nr:MULTISPECIES: hypothetical protein [unclassified Streptomyces]NEA56255.1 hypothetical protein [Streptomyces sp. SID13666]NEA71926.1 hypothetical protein [Streptomyces sp. SID13588]
MYQAVVGCTDPDPRFRLVQLVERGDALLRQLERTAQCVAAADRREAVSPSAGTLTAMREVISIYQKIAQRYVDADLDDATTLRHLADTLDGTTRCVRLLTPRNGQLPSVTCRP